MDDNYEKLVVENLDLQGEWSRSITFSGKVDIDSVFALFNGNTTYCDISSKDENVHIKLRSGATRTVTILKPCNTFNIKLQSEKSNVQLLSISATPPQDAHCGLYEIGIPIDIKDIKIIQTPAMGYQIAFDFSKAIKMLGTSENRKEVEIKNVVARFKIKSSRKTSQYQVDNFKWQGNKLLCRLVVGEYKLRMRLKKGEWSEWLSFKCKRPYSRG